MKFSIFLSLLNILRITLNFWCFGHQLIAKLAYSNLLPDVKTKVDNMVKLLNQDINEDFITSACWMDEIRNDGFDTFFKWHFSDQPFAPLNDIQLPDFNWDIDNSILIAEQGINVLKNKKLFSSFSEIFVVRVLTHVIGDMHQPLHNIEGQSKEFPNGDFGGNEIKVKLNIDTSKLKQTDKQPVDFENVIELHGLWDSVFGQMGGPFTAPIDKVKLQYWQNAITKMYPIENIDIGEENPRNWAKEMFDYGSKVQAPQVNDKIVPVHITEDYINDNIDNLLMFMAKGGQRLAELLNHNLNTSKKIDFLTKIKMIKFIINL